MKFAKSRKLQKLAHQLMPGGTQSYSKGDDQFPFLSPPILVKAQGAYIWDADGNRFIDWCMGMRSVILGHGYKTVIAAVRKQLPFGTNYNRPSHYEIELAKMLVELIPSAQVVKFAKNGSAATTAAVKLARAYTKRDLVAMCAGAFNGFDDWGIASTPMTAGIPKTVLNMTKSFEYNNIVSVRKMFKKYPKKIAAVILEPATEVGPVNNFLQEVQRICRQNGTILIFDEMISGFRWHLKGAQYVYKVTPDLSTFGKAISNGFALAALVGRKDIMELGGMDTKKERVALISATHAGENHALVAAIATLKELKSKNVPAYVNKLGNLLKSEFNKIARKHGLDSVLSVIGEFGCRIRVQFEDFGGYTAAQIKTYFAQEMISQGILFNGYFSPTLSHKKREVAQTLKGWEFSCRKLKEVLADKSLEKELVGEPIRPVFRKYN